MNEIKKTAIYYCRVSTKEQVENTSIETQKKGCLALADQLGVDILESFKDEGESAKTANRPNFLKAIDFCKKRHVDYFIVYKLDRFARNQSDHVMVQAILKKIGTQLKSATEPIDETPIGKAMEGVLAVFAEFDNNVRRERTTGGMLERARQGIWVWRAPLGYYRPNKGSNIVPDPDTAPYIRLCFEEWAKKTHSYRSLAQFLAKRGLRTKNGKKPFPQLIEKILKNPVYFGAIDAWENRYAGSFESIISEDLFLRCQKGYKDKRASNRISANPDFPLRNHTVCAECNTALTGSFSTGRKGKKYPYYHHSKQECPRASFIPKMTFEQTFKEYLQDITPGIRYEKAFKAIILDIWKTNYKKCGEQNRKIEKELKCLEEERLKVFDLHKSNVYNDEEFLEQKDRVNQRIYEKRMLLQEQHVEEFDMEQALSHCFQFVRNTVETWIRLGKEDFQLQQRFQRNIFPKKLHFDGEKFGTADLSLIYKLNKDSKGKKSNLVAPRGIEPRFSP